ncbi:C-type lectin domain family 4 member D-like isoform X2 [Tachysurus fulvidraco]|uniref:C-type lectin domain family 4 member D-like isoform X2 n=1 Tax=Tachysurus fulvidraco TaxID=1234273 RepID=UPI001FED5A0D|nr:C-type lectin domain family 4 member D-like isoform X2 [Tachysurus fulvidraco]
MSFEFYKMDDSENYHSPKDTEDDIYVNTEDCRSELKNSDISDRTELKDKKKPGKIFRSAFGLLILGVLLTLCVVGILYHNKVVSYEILSEQYSNVTETLMTQEHEAKETEKLYEALKVKHLEVQENLTACSETEKLYEALKVKHLEVQENLTACSEIEKLYEALKVKHLQVQEDLAACSANKNIGQCEEGWKSLGLKCYYFSSFKLNWEQSRDYCVEKGGHLVIITSQTEQNFVVSQIGETHWIGLHDLETEGQWMWVNNKPLKETGVTFWYSAPGRPDEPDNWKEEDPSGENCAALGHVNGDTDKWFDAHCGAIKKCICEK